MALQQLKDRFFYGGNLWFSDNPEAFILPYPYESDPQNRAKNMCSAIGGKWDDIKLHVSDNLGVVTVISEDTRITNKDLKLDYQGKDILVGSSVGSFIPADFLYAYALSYDDIYRRPLKHVELEQIREDADFWQQFTSIAERREDACNYIILEGDKPVVAFVRNLFWFIPGLEVSTDKKVRFKNPIDINTGHDFRRLLDKEFPASGPLIDAYRLREDILSEHDHAVLSYALERLRAGLPDQPSQEDLRQVVAGLHIDLAQYFAPSKQKAVTEIKLLEDKSPSSPLLLPPPVIKPTRLHGKFNAVVDAQGYLAIPAPWRDVIEKDFLIFYDRPRDRLICFPNEEAVQAFEERNPNIKNRHWYANLVWGSKRADGKFQIKDQILKSFRASASGDPERIPVLLEGHTETFTVSVQNPKARPSGP